MTKPEWRVRPGLPTDREMLARLRCADPAVAWQVEVEEFIQTRLIDWTFDHHAVGNDPRLLLAFALDSSELFGIVAHERVALEGPTGRFDATKLEVLAIALPWQGQLFRTGVRASDVLMSAAMTDITARVPHRDARVFAVVHEENIRSLSLCRRYGLVEEMSRPHPSYRRLVTPHRGDRL